MNPDRTLERRTTIESRWGAVLLASFTVHLLALSVVDVAPPAAAAWDSNVVDVTFTMAEEAPATAPAEVASAAQPDATPVQVPEVTRRRSRPIVEASQAAPAEPTDTRSTPAENELLLALDPSTAARAFVVSQQDASGENAEAEPEVSEAAQAEPKNYFAGVGEKRYLSVRDPPKLSRHRDGTHRYHGHAFRAIVEKDGSVTFDEGYAQGTTVRFDITDAIMRKRGEDPYRVEKEWFLEGTKELRQEVFQRWQAKQTLLAIRKLRVGLLRMLENEALTGDEKSARVIALFRDTSDDEAGALARDTIAEFVAERMPGVELPIDPAQSQ